MTNDLFCEILLSAFQFISVAGTWLFHKRRWLDPNEPKDRQRLEQVVELSIKAFTICLACARSRWCTLLSGFSTCGEHILA